MTNVDLVLAFVATLYLSWLLIRAITPRPFEDPDAHPETVARRVLGERRNLGR